MQATLTNDDITEEQARATFLHIMSSINEAHENMQADDREIARLKEETRQLKADSAQVMAEIHAALARLEAGRH